MRQVYSSYSGKHSLTGARAGAHEERARAAQVWERERRRRARRDKRANRTPGVKTVWCVLLGCTRVLLRTGPYAESLYVGCHRCKSPNPFKRVSL